MELPRVQLSCGVTVTLESNIGPGGHRTVVVMTDEVLTGFDAHLTPLLASAAFSGSPCEVQDTAPGSAGYAASVSVTATSLTLRLLGIQHTYVLLPNERALLAQALWVAALLPPIPIPLRTGVPLQA